MNQPEAVTPNVVAPLQQHKVQLISKGYSYHEVKEANAVISIFKACNADPQSERIAISPITHN